MTVRYTLTAAREVFARNPNETEPPAVVIARVATGADDYLDAANLVYAALGELDGIGWSTDVVLTAFDRAIEKVKP